jgi:Cof subfamily protein (haloacid dehalogenase superfamily)
MKAIVADLDGTLLKSDKSISSRTVAAINNIKDLGFSFIIATARPPRSVKLLPLDIAGLYVICYNGAEIYKDDVKIYSKYVDAAAAKTVVDWLITRYPGINISIEMNNHLYANFNIAQTTDWITPYTLADLGSFNYASVAKILVDLSHVDRIDEVKDMLPTDCGICVTDRGKKLGQIAHADVSKSNALRRLAVMLDIRLEDIMAFGDDFNDLDMIQDCGLGVAMGNSPLEVQEVADIVADTNDNDGVAIELEKIANAFNKDKAKEYWDNAYKQRVPEKPTYDLWLDKYVDILGQSIDIPIIDLGCGSGNDSLYLAERGYKVIACDMSEVATSMVRKFVPAAKTLSFDMLDGLPFPDASAQVIIADLSLHYFGWQDTERIIEEIKRVLVPHGTLLSRVNSIHDVNYGAGQGDLIEKNYYSVGGKLKRFFDKEQLLTLFRDWNFKHIHEYRMDRYGEPKILWEVAVEKR